MTRSETLHLLQLSSNVHYTDPAFDTHTTQGVLVRIISSVMNHFRFCLQ